MTQGKIMTICVRFPKHVHVCMYIRPSLDESFNIVFTFKF